MVKIQIIQATDGGSPVLNKNASGWEHFLLDYFVFIC